MKKIKNIILLSLLSMSLIACGQKMSKEEVEKYVENNKFNYSYQMSEYQEYLDNGLKKDSTVAYFWQQKAMPYFKAKKYEVGMKFLDEAVKYDREEWLPYRAFIKCIFAKTYVEAIKDFEECITMHGNSYVMDHTYEFYIAISNLQLNQFKKAEVLLEKNNDELFTEYGEEWLHPTVLFYLGISKYELNKNKEAIKVFDRTLALYPEFSDVKYYKAICLIRLGENEESKKVFEAYLLDAESGFSINEDNAIYETYPYQLKRKF